jgi:peptidoglycan/xylan/chitin deacetylase (PgdA/CDA1 family)/GT2 family glycosyltransferase
MKISIVVPTYNRRELIVHTLPTILDQTYPSNDYEVIVVIDGSTDGTAAALEPFKSKDNLRVLEQPNAGAAAARNSGVNAARGELILFLDDDICCDRKLVAAHVAAHQSMNAELVHGPVRVSPRDKPTLATDISAADAEDFYRSLSVSGIRLPQDAQVLCNSSLPRAIFLASGGFDEDMPFQRDDCELGLRLWKMGVRYTYCATAEVYEVSNKSSAAFGLRDAWQGGRGEVLLCKKHPSFRPYSALANLGSGTLAMRVARELCLRVPIVADSTLAISIWIAERFRGNSVIRSLGTWLLAVRKRLSFLRGAISEAGSWRSLKHDFGRRLPALLFHNVGDPALTTTYPGMTISPAQFKKQMSWLARAGYVGVRPAEWIAWCKQGTPLPTKPVLLTFDDAYAGVADHALPVLRERGFGAAVFVVTGQIGGTNAWEKETGGAGTDPLMTKSEIQNWAMQGIEFGAHSVNHQDLRKLNAEELEAEVSESGRELSQVVGSAVKTFAYPYGHYSDEARSTVAHFYDLACTCDEGLNDLGTDLCLLRRTMVHPEDTYFDMMCRARFGWSWVSEVRSVLRIRSRWRALTGHAAS